MNDISQQIAAFIEDAASDAKPVAKKERAKVWLNVGIEVNLGGKPVFVSLPYGIPFDSMKPVEVPAPNGKNQAYRHLMQAKNALYAAVQAKAAELDPGAETPLPTLSARLMRVNEEGAVNETEENPLLAAITL